MASVRSLGILKPSAIPYLIAEGVLPDKPSKELYRWQCYPKNGGVLDEVLIAESYVVWSRCNIIKRVLNLGSEQEPILHAITTKFNLRNDELGNIVNEEALVVVLKSHVHILLLSGDTHILPLSFEASAAFPYLNGFILQRKLMDDGADDKEMLHDLSTINESQSTLKPSSARVSLLLPEVALKSSDQANGMPRSFSCIDPMSELGLVVCGSTDKARSLQDCVALPSGENIAYLSHHDELEDLTDEHEPLCLAVTVDLTKDTLTIWHVAGDVPASTRTKSKKPKTTRRSHAGGRSTNTNHKIQHAALTAPREPHALRQSFGGLAQSYADNIHSSGTDQKSSVDLADQLGPEFEQTGVQTRSSRRVSSMLARTDLGAGNDRNTFNELAMGHANRKSMGRSGLRGESIGSFGDRQSFGMRRKSSFHAATSILSTGTSFLNIPGQAYSEYLDTEAFSELLLDDLGETSDLSRDLGFFKLTTVAWDEAIAKAENLSIFAFLSPQEHLEEQPVLSVCLLDQQSTSVAIVSIKVEVSGIPGSRRTKLKASSVRRGSGISSTCLVKDGGSRRLLVLAQTRQEEPFLQLEAPWSPSFRVEIPASLLTAEAQAALLQSSPKQGKDESRQRIVNSSEISAVRVLRHGENGEIGLIDSSDVVHLLQVQLAPVSTFVKRVLAMCNYVLGNQFYDALVVAFWEVSRWSKSRSIEPSEEWTILVTTIFALAVPFLGDRNAKSSTPSRRKKSALLRSSSGSAVDLSHFRTMIETHAAEQSASPSPAWDWLSESSEPPLIASPTSRPSKHVRGPSLQSAMDDPQDQKKTFVMQCVTAAREFVQSPAGETMIGPEGYLPTAISKDRGLRQTTIAKITVGLHLLYEEERLSQISKDALATIQSIPAVLAQLGTWLGWSTWTLSLGSYYATQLAGEEWPTEDTSLTSLDPPAEPFPPPSILSHICENIHSQTDISFLTLADVADRIISSTPDHDTRQPGELTPLTDAVLSLLQRRPWIRSDTLAAPDTWDISTEALRAMPDTIVAVFLQAAATFRSSRKLLSSSHSQNNHKNSLFALSLSAASHHASKDYHNAGAAAFEGESTQRWDLSSEVDRQAVSRILFQADRRFQEASRLVNQTRPPVVECETQSHWSEADILEAQKELAQLVACRTLSIASGRAMMHYSAREPLLTERVPIPAFSLQCLIQSRGQTESTQAMTFSADKSSFTEEKVCWAFFHNGASAGLMISKYARCVDTSWILYNKPQELTNRHAGFLLALGLNGHLRSLAKWVAFKYLTPKHTMTSIGLLLGLSASYLGTQDQLITRLLSVHVTRLLPLGAAELNLSPLTQTTGIIGIGLLYHSSQHRRMSEVMLSELENNDSEEGIAEELVLRDEGYRLAAGFSLGLINLGHGTKLHSLRDMAVAERLLAIAISTKNVNLVHVLDRATAGAVMATALIYMKTNDSAIAAKIDIPDTIHQFDYVRPDIFLLRTLARHLVMWDSILPTQAHVTRSLPKQYRHRASLHKTVNLATEDLPFFNILAGICFALSLRYAGTQQEDVRNLLVSYLDHFLRLSRLPCPHYDARVTVNGVRNCLDIVALSAATVMAGSGDLIVLRRLRSLHGRTDKDTPFGSHMAAHMALGALFLGGGTMTFGTSNLAVASLCIAFYPLFPNDVLDNKVHLQALRHLWVLASESRCLVCKEKESGTLVGGVIASVHLKTGDTQLVRSPGLLPELSTIESVDVEGDGWWSVNLDFKDARITDGLKEQGVLNVLLTRKKAFDSSPGGESLAEEMRILDEQSMNGASGQPSCNADLADRAHLFARPAEDNPFEWLFKLDTFKTYDLKERELVLGQYDGDGNRFLEGTPLDARLAVERGLLPNVDGMNDDHETKINADKLLQVRSLLQWFDEFDNEDEQMDANAPNDDGVRWRSGVWLRREVVNRLRARVFEMMDRSEDVS